MVVLETKQIDDYNIFDLSLFSRDAVEKEIEKSKSIGIGFEHINPNNSKNFPRNLELCKKLMITDSILNNFNDFPKESPKLEDVELLYSYIEDFEGFPEKLPKIDIIKIKKSEINSLKGMPAHLDNLQELNINDSKIDSKLSEFPITPNLKRISIIDSTIDMSDNLPEMQNLYSLYLDNIESKKISIPDAKNLSRLSIYNIPFHKLKFEGELNNLNHTVLENMDITDISKLTKKLFSKNTYLNLNNFSDFTGMQKSNSVNLLEANSSNIKSLKGLNTPNLERLRINDNELSILNGDNLENLESIEMKNNKSDFYGFRNFTNLPKLEYLNIENSNVQTLNGLPQNIPNLKEINISKNPLSDLTGFPISNKKISVIMNDMANLKTLKGVPKSMFITVIDQRNDKLLSNLKSNNKIRECFTTIPSDYYSTPLEKSPIEISEVCYKAWIEQLDPEDIINELKNVSGSIEEEKNIIRKEISEWKNCNYLSILQQSIKNLQYFDSVSQEMITKKERDINKICNINKGEILF